VEDVTPLANLSNLATLDLQDTQVADLTPLANLTSLTTLELRETEVADLSPLANLSNLTALYLSGTQVADLTPLANLSKLASLYLRETQVVDLTALANLSNLTTLDLRRTKLTDLTPLIALIRSGIPVKGETNLISESGIYVKDCPLTSPPPDIVKRGNDAILNYFREKVAADSVDNLYEAKMLILGDGGAGKTSLLRRLFRPDLPLPATDETTEGIDIHRHEWTLPNGRRFRLNVWDFGGQQIYHATHHFFLTRRSLYLLVDDTVKSDKNVTDPGFQYWLERVEVHGGRSPVLIFQNEKRGLSKTIDLPGIQHRYSNVMRLYAGDLNQVNAAAALRSAIEHFAASLPHICEELPSKWIDIRQEIETRARQVPFIDQKEYFQIYGRHLLFDRTKALHLSQYLHDLGVFLHFQEDELLGRSVFLQNEWVTQAVFRILRDKAIIGHRGRFSHADCNRLWQGSTYLEKVPELLALMERFELCYKLRDQVPDTWLAPLLLPPTRPDALKAWSQPEDLTLRYRYSFLPSGIISRLMVRLHRYVRNDELAWTTGVLFEKHQSQVLVELLPNGGEIELRACGPEAGARDFRNIVAEELEALNASIDGLRDKVDALIPCHCEKCRAATTPHYFSKAALVRRREHGRNSVECEISYKHVDVLKLLEGIARTTPAKHREVRIFLASSSELREDRDEFDRYFSRQDNPRLRIARWEDFHDAMSKTRLQDEYNHAVRESDIFVSLFATKAGQYTVEEFKTALEQFKATGRPRIYVFVKETSVKATTTDRKALKSLWSFTDRLKKLGHYHTNYTNIQDLKLQFKDQLDKLVASGGI